MMSDDGLPPLPPFAEALLEAEQRRPPPSRRAKRSLWRRARRTLVASGLLAPAALAAQATGAALATKIGVVSLVAAVAGVGVGAAIKLGGREPPAMPEVITQRPSPEPPPSLAPPPPIAPVVVPRAPARDFNAEAALIDEARAALARQDPRRAADALSRHQRHFPTGVFQEEREALRVVVLALGGHDEQARVAAARFRLRYPRSLFRDVVDRAPVGRSERTRRHPDPLVP
jgi:hypothetical protein